MKPQLSGPTETRRLLFHLDALLLFILLCGQSTWAALPSGWSDADIGSPGIAGSATAVNGGWTIAGGGSDIWNAADQFNFASASYGSDGTIIAEVTSLQNSDPSSGWSKAGVMFRNDTTAASANVSIVISATEGVNFQWRSTAGAQSYDITVAGVSAPVWLQLTRSGGDNFAGYYSQDGTNWTFVGTVPVAMNGTVQAGLAVTAHNNSALNTATFTNVSLSSQSFGIYRQMWTNLDENIGNTLAMLTNASYNPNWPNNPAASCTHVFTEFETEIDSGTNYYGQDLQAYLVPPVSGDYIFWIASDDTSLLLLSPDETPADAVPIASVTGWCTAGDYTEEPNQQSASIYLQGGRRYYLQALMQQGTGGDNLSVQWELPDGTVESPLAAASPSGTLLVPYTGVVTLPSIYLPPTSVTTIENTPATFSLLVTNQSSVTYQWQLGTSNLNGATSSVLVLTNVALSQSGESFRCIVSDTAGSVTSAPVTLNVNRDTTPPTVARAFNVGPTNVEIIYSKQVNPATATNISNYVFTNGLPITAASLNADGETLVLTTGPLIYGSNYSIVINGVTDLASTPNMIATNTTVAIQANTYTPYDIGNPSVGSTITYVPNGLHVTTEGGDFGGTADQGNLSYQIYTGNFDVCVRVANLGLSDIFAKAGLTARESLTNTGRFAASFATPTMNGAFFEWRDPAGGSTSTAGNFPANYPNTWLRLQRLGNTFTGFAGYDGQTWTELGSDTITMSNQVYLGFAVASVNTNQATTAQFANFASVTNGVIGKQINPHDAMGPSSRTTPIAFSEIMWKPAARTDGKNLEFLEIYNSNPWFQDISDYQITCADMKYTFPSGTTIPGGGYLVIAAVPSDIESVYGITNVMGPYTGSLKHSETLELLDEETNVLLTVPYTDVYPWPVASDATGHSIVLANPTYGEGDPRAWDISDVVGGSPGQMDGFTPSPLRNVMINEILPHSENPAVPQFIELYNHSTDTVDVSGCILTDDPTTNKFVIPNGTTIGPAGFISFTQFGFTLNGAGETLYFIKPDGTRVLDAVQFGAQADGVSYGRWPDGANDFYAFTTNTPGAGNSSILIGDIVINELMYDPISEDDNDQYIELYNKGTNTISLAGWQFTSGVTFTFPTNAIIGPNGYVVVGKNTANLFAHYTNLNSANTFGNFSGKLSHNGELVVLAQPETLFVTNTIYVEEDEVTYGTGGRWGEWSGGGGSSLELIDPHSNHRLAANWADSDDTAKSVWTNITYTGVLDNGANYDATIDYAQIGILDVGECLVGNINVNYNGVNYVLNSNFNNGSLANWTLQGDHTRSSVDSPGFNSSYALHMRCSDKIWTGDNSCQMALAANSMGPGNTVTLGFEARWLHGWPEALLRLNGNWLEATGPMPVPSNLGSPGLPNSTYITNAGPAVYNVTHYPTVPAANQPVVVTANVSDPDGVQRLILHYRLDPATNYFTVQMKDDGTGGDAVPNDGVYSAAIPGQAANQIAAYYIVATDNTGAQTRFPSIRTNDNEPVRECVVMFGDGNPGGSFGVYHLWVTQTNATRWANLGNLSNEGNDCTMVTGNRVFYNIQARFAGSPYHQQFDTPSGALCHYKWEFNDDDKFLGATDFNKIHQPGNGPGDDASLQREQMANSLLRALGVPWLNRRYVAVYVNGNRRGYVMEDAQTPSGDVVKEHYPNDSDGFLFKMQPWFEFAPQLSGEDMAFDNQSWCNLMPYTTTGGVLKKARYRYNFEMRRTPDSDNDYTNVFSLVEAAVSSGTSNFVANMENLADMENWMRVFAANHAAGNWDSFGAQNGQNLYGYIGTNGTKYSLLMWDFNIVFGNSGSWGPGQNLFTLNGEDTNMANIYANPTFLRMYWRALQNLANGPLNVANSGPLLMAKYNAFTQNGFSVENPASNLELWLANARAAITVQLATVNASSFTVNQNVTVSNNVAYITGTAPVNVDTVQINGVSYPLTWTSLTGWTVAAPLLSGTNNLSVVGVNNSSQPIAGDSGSVSVVYSPTNASPVGQVVINEIMYDPAVTGAQYVELYNKSTNLTFDLSGWQLQPLGYTFLSGSTIAPASYKILAQNGADFDAAYGATTPISGTFADLLPSAGTLILSTPNNVTVAEVAYENQSPWPTNAAGTGSSLQLIDPNQDNWREGNWSVVLPNSFTPQWTYVTVTGTASSSTFYIYLQSAGDVYVDDIQLVAGSVAGVGANALSDGNFESGFPGPWTVSPNLSGSVLSTNIKHSGNASLHVISTAAGTTQSSAIWQTMSPALTANATYTLSFWYLQSTNGGPLTLRLSGSGIVGTVNPAPPASVFATATPGIANSDAASLTPFPSLWINELEPDNLTGITNSAGGRTPWVEIYNPSTNVLSLNGLYLSDNYSNLLQWAFPSSATINAGQYLVIFVDGQTALSSASELHTSFVLPNPSGSLALTRLYNGQPQVLDYVDYQNIIPNDSYGSLPNGQSFIREEFIQPTPGAANNVSGTPPPSFVDYAQPGSIYTQNFDSLPDPGATSVDANNAVTINGTTYSLANPFDFAYPSAAQGKSGGLNLAAMAGWYGLGVAASQFGASDGDQKTGGDISFGLASSANRALGLLATSSTSGTAFGVRFINGTDSNLGQINVGFTGELWRQSNLPKTVEFYYYMDLTGVAPFPSAVTGFIPALNVTFPTLASDSGGDPVNGTTSANQTSLAVTNQPIAIWPPGAALWLVWAMPDSTGKAQGIGIDNFSFSANAPAEQSMSCQTVSTNNRASVQLNWTGNIGQIYQLEYNDDLSTTNWLPLGNPVTGNGGKASATVTPGASSQRFFRLRLIN